LFTITQISKITGRSENLIRQHIYRKHLEASKTEVGTFIEKKKLLSWAKDRDIKIDQEVLTSFETFKPDTSTISANLSKKSTRSKILLLKEGNEIIFLGCSIKIRSVAVSLQHIWDNHAHLCPNTA